MDNINRQDDCGYKCGQLPECAPLALAYVPMQQSSEPAYGAGEALTRGTLFPGLDLPFKSIVNKMPAKTQPLRELMALDFVVNELVLYLDTHKDDKEAFATLRSSLKLYKQAKERYARLYGPLCWAELEESGSFNWLDGPWPWEYCASED